MKIHGLTLAVLFLVTIFCSGIYAIVQTCQECSAPCQNTTTVECIDGMCYTNTTGGETSRGCALPANTCDQYSPQTVVCCNDRSNCNAIPEENTTTTTQAPTTTTTTAAQGPTTTTAAQGPTTTTAAQGPTTTTTTAAQGPTTTTTAAQEPTTTTAAPTTTTTAEITTTKAQSNTTSGGNVTPKLKCLVCNSVTAGDKCGLDTPVIDNELVKEETQCSSCSARQIKRITNGTASTTYYRDCHGLSSIFSGCIDYITATNSTDTLIVSEKGCCKEDRCTDKLQEIRETPIQCYTCSGTKSNCGENPYNPKPCYGQCYTTVTTLNDIQVYTRGCKPSLCKSKGSGTTDFTNCCGQDNCNNKLERVAQAGNSSNLCYQCTSSSNDNCPENSDDFANVANKKTIPCSGQCFKTVVSAFNVVTRGCMATCVQSATGEAEIHCCAGNLCNHGNKVTSGSVLAFLGMTLVMAVTQLRF